MYEGELGCQVFWLVNEIEVGGQRNLKPNMPCINHYNSQANRSYQTGRSSENKNFELYKKYPNEKLFLKIKKRSKIEVLFQLLPILARQTDRFQRLPASNN